jgi:hypothetical protein
LSPTEQSRCIIIRPTEASQDARHGRRTMGLDLTLLLFMFVAVLIIFGVHGRRDPE